MDVRPFKRLCPTNYCIDGDACVFTGHQDERVPVVLWNVDYSPLSLDEMRQVGYHSKRCRKPSLCDDLF